MTFSPQAIACLFVITGLMLTGCTTKPSTPSVRNRPLFPVLSATAAERRAPLLLRMRSPYPVVLEEWNPEGVQPTGAGRAAVETAGFFGGAARASLYNPILLPMVPFAIVAGVPARAAVESAEQQALTACRQSWHTAFGDNTASNVSLALTQQALPPLLDVRLRRRFEEAGIGERLRPVSVEKPFSGVFSSKREFWVEGFEEKARSLGKSIIVAGQIRAEIVWGMLKGKCGFRLSLVVPLSLVEFDPQTRLVTTIDLEVSRDSFNPENISSAAGNPEFFGKPLREAAEELADKVANSYFP